jgi:hypothetical protein
MFSELFCVTVQLSSILGSDWRALHKLDATPDHILPAIGLELQAFKSISAEYPELPE